MDYDEEQEPELLEEEPEAGGGQEDPETVDQNGDHNIVESGDAGAAAAAKSQQKNSVTALKSKKVANDQRSTTPYMTKYEKARILGTRALQIRYVGAVWIAKGMAATKG
jgi:DNA-directed RNA polymerase I, II, and III subunit RPABC2